MTLLVVRANIYHRSGLCAGLARSTPQRQAECDAPRQRKSKREAAGATAEPRTNQPGRGKTTRAFLSFSGSRPHTSRATPLRRQPRLLCTAFPHAQGGSMQTLLTAAGTWGEGEPGGATQKLNTPANANMHTHTRTRTH